MNVWVVTGKDEVEKVEGVTDVRGIADGTLQLRRDGDAKNYESDEWLDFAMDSP